MHVDQDMVIFSCIIHIHDILKLYIITREGLACRWYQFM